MVTRIKLHAHHLEAAFSAGERALDAGACSTEEVDECVQRFTDLLLELVKKHTPVGKARGPKSTHQRFPEFQNKKCFGQRYGMILEIILETFSRIPEYDPESM